MISEENDNFINKNCLRFETMFEHLIGCFFLFHERFIHSLEFELKVSGFMDK